MRRSPRSAHSRRPLRALSALTITMVLAAAGVTAAAGPALADGPGQGAAWVVTLGDSYISGEAGRWAGNSDLGESHIDALGPTAYYDNASNNAELINGCHRSKADEAYLGGGVNGKVLACSGATTATHADSGNFKPGLDFYRDSSGNQGQALMLQNFAATHNVKLVAVSIGGNNYNFASIVQSCVEDFLLSPSWWPDYCYDDSSVTANFTAANVATQTAAIKTALLNVHQAMANAGYADSAYTILVQDYPSPLPPGAGFRYSQSGYTRQSTGGCGFWNADANWANSTALVTINNSEFTAAAQTGLSNIRTLDVAAAFNGHRLCENTVGMLEEEGLNSWTDPAAVNLSEWINQIRTVSTIGSDYYIQESLHPDYWGQLALRNCLRQAYNNGAVRSGSCTISGTGLNAQGEPVMPLH